MKFKNLIDSNNWLSVKLILLELYPDQETMLSEYENVFQLLKLSQPVDSDMSIALTERKDDFEDENEPSTYIDVSGIKKQKEENPIADSYALEFVEWKEWLGMDFVPATLANFTELEIIAHCLYEMTFISFDENEIKQQLETLDKQVEEYKNMSEEERNQRTMTLEELKEKLNERESDDN